MLKELQNDFLPQLEREWRALLSVALSNSPMHEMLEYHRATGGKRLRAMAVVLAAEPFLRRSGQSWRGNSHRILPAALAVELVHNATLIHDDIQDGDTHRRGQETLWRKFSAAQGINCGDALFFLAFRALEKAGYDPSLELFLMRELERATFTVIEGQSREFALKEKLKKSRKFSSEEYETMARGKTAALFSLPYVCGARMAGASDAEVSEWRGRAEKIGVVFQIQDDVLDLWGDKGRDRRGTDIAEGKISYPVVQTFRCLEREGRAEEMRWLADVLLSGRESTRHDDIEKAITLMEHCGVREQCLQEVADGLGAAVAGDLARVSFGPLAEAVKNAMTVPRK